MVIEIEEARLLAYQAALAEGLGCASVNSLDKKMMANIIVAETLIGRDEFCTNYLHAYRSGKFEA